MFVVNGNSAKARETQVKWRNLWCREGVMQVAWLPMEPDFLLTNISDSNKAPTCLPPERSWPHIQMQKPKSIYLINFPWAPPCGLYSSSVGFTCAASLQEVRMFGASLS